MSTMIRPRAEAPARLPARLLGTGSCVPETILSNADVADACGVDPAWIERRTGLTQRRRAAPWQATSDLGTTAAERALRAAGLAPSDLGLVICTTCSPDHGFPSTAALIARNVGARGCAAFDLEAGCAGFVYAAVLAAQQVATGLARAVLVVGADVMSRMVDPSDRATAPIFGDGAGAAVFGPAEGGEGFEAVDLGADGAGAGLLQLPAGGSRQPASRDTLGRGDHSVRMRGPALYRSAVRHTVAATRRVLGEAGLLPEDIALVVPHQSSRRLLTAAAKACGFSMDRVAMNLHLHGNTACGSIPLALDEAVRAGRIQAGDRVLLLGFGAGLAWGAGLLRL